MQQFSEGVQQRLLRPGAIWAAWGMNKGELAGKEG